MAVYGADFQPGTRIVVEPKTASGGHTYEFVKREDGSWRGLMHHVKGDRELSQGYVIKDVLGLGGAHYRVDAHIGDFLEDANRAFDRAIQALLGEAL